MRYRILCPLLGLLFASSFLYAEALETQSNPVDLGAITVAVGDTDRSDWADIPWYEYDDDFADFYPVDIDRIQVAHDNANLYLHVTALEWDTEETWRVGIYMDTDQDLTTGYTGGFLPVGSDHFLEDAGAFEFTAELQEDWGWNQAGESVREQSDLLDFELAIPRSAIGNPTNVDFVLYANNTCCDFQMPDDIYPNEPGFFLSYELGEATVLPGDFNADGLLDTDDINALGVAVATMDVSLDLTDDQTTNVADIERWLEIKGSLNGDADLSGDVGFADFLLLSDSFGKEASWSGGDFDGNGIVQFPDFLLLSSNFGMSVGAQAVPEPSSTTLLFFGVIVLAGCRRARS